MILDRLENLKDYVALNPHFAKVVDFLSKNDLAGLPLGRNVIDGDYVYASSEARCPCRLCEPHIAHNLVYTRYDSTREGARERNYPQPCGWRFREYSTIGKVVSRDVDSDFDAKQI